MNTKYMLIAKRAAIWIARTIMMFYLTLYIALPIGYYVGASIRLHRPLTLHELRLRLQKAGTQARKGRV